MRKRAYIIAAFYSYSYDVRIRYVAPCLEKLGFEVKVITSNFDHRNKKKYEIDKSDVDIISVPEYKSNLSIKRIRSHYVYAKHVYKLLNDERPDLIYVITPPNFLFSFVGKFRKKNDSIVIFDIDDVWPESLPIGGTIKKLSTPILKIWSGLRDHNLKYADGVICECNLFKNIISANCGKAMIETIYMCKRDYGCIGTPTVIKDNVLSFAYIGSINNIIDIDFIISFLSEINNYKTVSLDIIGNGEKSDDLIDELQKRDILYTYHGAIYDNQEKNKILRECQFAINVMKPSVTVGATMKSLEYFHWGLALINNIPADTEDIVNTEKCGFNITPDNFKDVEMKLAQMTNTEIEMMKKNSRKVFLSYFEEQVVVEKFLEFLNIVLNQK